MDIVSSDWSLRHKELSSIIRKSEQSTDIIEMILGLHKELHSSRVSGSVNANPIDAIMEDLQQNECAVMPTPKDETIAWAIWHLARIEDMTMNILVNKGAQVFDESWKNRMNTAVSDTGNAMTDDEIIRFSEQVRIDELLRYRDAVGIRSREIVSNLQSADMKRKVSREDTARIFREGGVTEHSDSIWLLDFWGRKDVAGIILMPLTRHQTVHLNDCYKWKKAIRKKVK